jgi:transposase
MRKAFKYRLYPTATQAELLRMRLSEACRLYNTALQERRDAYRTHRKSLNYYDQASQLKEIRDGGGLALPNYHCAQDVLKRVEKTFQAFFDRMRGLRSRRVHATEKSLHARQENIRRRKDGNADRYFSVVENHRMPSNKTVQPIPFDLCEINEQQQAEWGEALSGV